VEGQAPNNAEGGGWEGLLLAERDLAAWPKATRRRREGFTAGVYNRAQVLDATLWGSLEQVGAFPASCGGERDRAAGAPTSAMVGTRCWFASDRRRAEPNASVDWVRRFLGRDASPATIGAVLEPSANSRLRTGAASRSRPRRISCPSWWMEFNLRLSAGGVSQAARKRGCCW